MANAMSTRRLPLRLRHQLLLLSAYAIVAYSKISTASSVDNGRPDQYLNTQSKTDPKEERVPPLPVDTVEAVEKLTAGPAFQLRPSEKGFIVKLIRDQISPEMKSLLEKPTLKAIANLGWLDRWTLEDEVESLFSVIIHAARNTGPQGESLALDELTQRIIHFMGTPELPIPGVETAEYQAVVDHNRLRIIVLELKSHLVERWNFLKYTPDSVYEKLKVDVASQTFFEDPNVSLWIEFLIKNTDNDIGKAFDLVVAKFLTFFKLNEVVTKVAAAVADSKHGDNAERFLRALFRAWDRSNGRPETLLLKIVPSLEGGDIFHGPLKLWIEYYKPKLKEKLYTRLLWTLLHPIGEPSYSRFTSDVVPRNENKELALVDIIATEWAKNFQILPGATESSYVPSPSSSPIANSLFKALCTHWKNNKVTILEMRSFLRLNDLEDTPRLIGRQRVELMFGIVTRYPMHVPNMLNLKLTEKAKAELVAWLVDWGEGLHHQISDRLFEDWRKLGKTKEDVFKLLQLPSPVDDLFHNRLLTVWYLYTPSEMRQVERLKRMRTFLKSQTVGHDLAFELAHAVRTSDGVLQRVLFDLLAIQWVVHGRRILDIPILHFPSTYKMQWWYKELLENSRNGVK